MPLNHDDFLNQQAAIRGAGNPQAMHVALWEELVRSGESSHAAAWRYKCLDNRVRPGWSFDRYGMTRTRLANGRIICIAGEHEDYYDPDFFIYNDVIVIWPGGELNIYGYSTEVFPPTDFHTATLIGDAIFVIGGLGYQGKRGGATTPLYRLDIASMSIERLTPENSGPGWIFRHNAQLAPDGTSIRVWDGETSITDTEGKEAFRVNDAVFSFNTTQKTWLPAETIVSASPAPEVSELPPDWNRIENHKEAKNLQESLMRAVTPDHALFCPDFWPIAQQSDWPHRILIQMVDGTNRWAVCDEPEYSGREGPPGLAVTFYTAFRDLVDANSRMRPGE